jgi:hypothetical protein
MPGWRRSTCRLVSNTPKPAEFDTTRGLTFVNSDLAFGGKYVYQGNFAGFTIWDVSNPAKPKMSRCQCITSQGDPSIYGNLLFISAEGGGNRNDCGKGGVQNPEDHMAGVRIFDVSDPANPRFVKNVQTCKGSHTHTIVPHSKKDKDIIYLYVSGITGRRAPETELAGCKNGDDPADETNSLFRLDVIKVTARKIPSAEVVTGARIFTDLDAAPRAAVVQGRAGPSGRPRRGRRAATGPDGPAQLPRRHRVSRDEPAGRRLRQATACWWISRNPEKPVRLSARRRHELLALAHRRLQQRRQEGRLHRRVGRRHVADVPGVEHDGDGRQHHLTINGGKKKFTQHAYFKIPTAQSGAGELRVAQRRAHSRPWARRHGAGLVPGRRERDRLHRPDKPFEVGYFDRGLDRSVAAGVDVPVTPAPATAGRPRARHHRRLVGRLLLQRHDLLVGDGARLRRLELKPTDQLSANEIAAAKLVRFEQYNPQSQPRIVWPAAFPVVRSYLDQLVRNQGLAAARTTAIDQALTAAEAMSGRDRRRALTALAAEVDKDVAGAKDAARVRTMAAEIRRLAAASR